MGLEQFDTILAFAAVMLTLSLLATILVQMVLSFCNMRGKELHWGLEKLLQQVDPQLKLGDIAGKLGDAVLKHPSIQHLGRTRAIAIRKEELLKVLDDLASRPLLGDRIEHAFKVRFPKDDETPKKLMTVVDASGILEPKPWSWWKPWSWPIWRRRRRLTKDEEKQLKEGFKGNARDKADELLTIVRNLLVEPWAHMTSDEQRRLADAMRAMAPSASAEQAQSAAALTNELLATFPEAADAVRGAVSKALQAKRQLEAEIEKWFDTVMDRTTERFVLQTRWVTALVAAVLAVALHIDSLSIFAQLTSSKDLRGQWIEASGGLIKEAEKLSIDTQRPWPVGTMAIEAMKKDQKLAADDKAKIEKVPTELATRREGMEWLAGKKVSQDGQDLYTEKVNQVAKERFDELSNAFTNVRKVASGTSLQIVQWPWPPLSARAAIGVVMTALLLGLGAPFWFNLLKQLTALRPIIAGKVEKNPDGGRT